LASFLPVFLRDQYRVTPVAAGYLTALVAVAGSGVRPVGGLIADRIGGVRLLSWLLVGVVGSYFLAARLPALPAMLAILIIGMMCLGLGNGAVFQLVPQCFRNQIGVATGFIGAIGGLGGFFLPTLLGQVKQSTGSFQLGFVALGAVALTALVLLRVLMRTSVDWSASWRHATPVASPTRRAA
jgi:Nitrate/nitrite transporter